MDGMPRGGEEENACVREEWNGEEGRRRAPAAAQANETAGIRRSHACFKRRKGLERAPEDETRATAKVRQTSTRHCDKAALTTLFFLYTSPNVCGFFSSPVSHAAPSHVCAQLVLALFCP